MKNINYLCLICLVNCLQVSTHINAQVNPTSKNSIFECEVMIDIYNGLKDWEGGISYSGGQLLHENKKRSVGAVTVVNNNNTDGDFNPDESEKTDSGDNSVSSTMPIGRNEIDLMKIVVKKRNPNAPLSGSGNVIFKIPTNVKIWQKGTKEVEISAPGGEIEIPSSELEMANKIYYVEALSPSMTKRDMKFQIEYNGGMDYALATAVWVNFIRAWNSDSSIPIPGITDLENADKAEFKNSINNTWISENSQRYGFGPFFTGQSLIGGAPLHPLTGILPGIQNKQNGGRILFEFQIWPPNSEELVDFDCARQKKVRAYKIYDILTDPILVTTINFPYESGENIESPNDDTNNTTDEDQLPTNSFIYSFDIPSSYIIRPDDPGMGFIINKITFVEFVRLKVKKPNPLPNDILFGLNEFGGSRCSNNVEWHCNYYLRRSTADRRLLADNQLSSFSFPNKFSGFTGNGTIIISTSPTAPTASYTLMYSADDSWLILDENGLGDSFNRNLDGVSWTINYNGVQSTISEGAILFSENDTFVFNVFNSSQKLNEISLGSSEVTTPP